MGKTLRIVTGSELARIDFVAVDKIYGFNSISLLESDDTLPRRSSHTSSVLLQELRQSPSGSAHLSLDFLREQSSFQQNSELTQELLSSSESCRKTGQDQSPRESSCFHCYQLLMMRFSFSTSKVLLDNV